MVGDQTVLTSSQVHRARDRMELDVRRRDDRRRDRRHEFPDVRRYKVPLQRLAALPLLDKHELVLAFGVLVQTVTVQPASARDAAATTCPTRIRAVRLSASL